MIDIKQVLRETTDWNFSNHDYLLGPGGKLIGYRRDGDTGWQIFKKPLSFSKRGRSFIKLKETPTEFIEPYAVNLNPRKSLMEFMV
jgi:hypothetical protein